MTGQVRLAPAIADPGYEQLSVPIDESAFVEVTMQDLNPKASNEEGIS
jgi:hypothetical protein